MWEKSVKGRNRRKNKERGSKTGRKSKREHTWIKNKGNLAGGVKKQNVLQLTSLTDETSEEKNSLFARKGSYLYLFWLHLYCIWKVLYLDRRSCCAKECLKNHFRNLQVHFAVYLSSFVCYNSLKPALARAKSPKNWDSQLSKNLSWGYTLVPCFVKNYTIHTGYEFGCAGPETQA